MPDARIVTAARRFKAELERREKRQVWEMARRWREVEMALRADIQALAEQISRLAAEGRPITPGKLYQLERYQRLLIQAQAEFARYAQWAGRAISEAQREWTMLSLEHAVELLSVQSGIGFDRLPASAVEYLVGVTGEGGPVADLLLRRMVTDESGLPLPGVHQRLIRSLITATARGLGPGKTARLLQDDLAGGLQKAMLIARTEQLRAYREASRAQYEASGVVVGYRRMAAVDERTCLACLLLDGRIYSPAVSLPDHPQGRCTLVPIVDGEELPEWETGTAWLLRQNHATQMRVMGKERFRLWRAGQLDLAAMAEHTHDETWGGSVRTVPVRDSTGAGGAGTRTTRAA